MTYAERLSDCQAWYTGARKGGKCKYCGATGGYLKIGLHPSGKRGQPIKLVKADINALGKWVEEAGWVCSRCCLVGGAGGASTPVPQATTLELVEELKTIRTRKSTVSMDAKEWDRTIAREKEIRKLLDGGT